MLVSSGQKPYTSQKKRQSHQNVGDRILCRFHLFSSWSASFNAKQSSINLASNPTLSTDKTTIQKTTTVKSLVNRHQQKCNHTSTKKKKTSSSRSCALSPTHTFYFKNGTKDGERMQKEDLPTATERVERPTSRCEFTAGLP
ncbi:hypothetical protein CEXT_190751 [Caerostris extrusa]|uniref:Uncharacterized protein n=1 Tax=Caerostris extrusa TaxID=172846 RepID=A0AAV4VV54_CAEEX|nr:hypothetical protein CEXT_190751 [Caerostris extrusa]